MLPEATAALLDFVALLQGNRPGGAGWNLFNFFAGFFLILFIFCGALLFTYWISRED
jgi:hypothetical protein